jgi:hypothetical protein
MLVPIEVKQRAGNRIERTLLAQKQMVIPVNSKVMVPITVKGQALPKDRDFLFEPENIEMGIEGGFPAAVVDAQTTYIEAQNATERPITISRRQRLGKIVDFDAEGCFMVNSCHVVTDQNT